METIDPQICSHLSCISSALSMYAARMQCSFIRPSYCVWTQPGATRTRADRINKGADH